MDSNNKKTSKRYRKSWRARERKYREILDALPDVALEANRVTSAAVAEALGIEVRTLMCAQAYGRKTGYGNARLTKKRTGPKDLELSEADQTEYDDYLLVMRSDRSQSQAAVASRLGVTTRALERLLARVRQVEKNRQAASGERLAA